MVKMLARQFTDYVIRFPTNGESVSRNLERAGFLSADLFVHCIPIGFKHCAYSIVQVGDRLDRQLVNFNQEFLI